MGLCGGGGGGERATNYEMVLFLIFVPEYFAACNLKKSFQRGGENIKKNIINNFIFNYLLVISKNSFRIILNIKCCSLEICTVCAR